MAENKQLLFSFCQEAVKKDPPSSSSSKDKKFTPITIESGLDKKEARQMAMLTLRGLISQNLKRSVGKDNLSLKNRERFMSALATEIKFKRSSLDAAYLIQDVLLRSFLKS